MEMEGLFREQKWNILSSLCEGKYSPLQLAERANTTIANISQQLRLLEAAELVKKEKIQNREKGKPRTLFSLSHESAYLVSTMKDFARKKLLHLNDYHRTLMRILFVDNPDNHYVITKFFLRMEDHLDEITRIAVNPLSEKVELTVVGEKPKEIEKKVSKIVPTKRDGTKISVSCITENEFKKRAEELHVIYDHPDLESEQTTGGTSH